MFTRTYINKVLIIFVTLTKLLFSQTIHDFGRGSRPAALGHSFISLANDANATFYNTAGSAFLERSQITFQHIFLKESRSYFNLLSFNHIMGDYGTFNVGFIKTSLFDNDDNLNYLNLGYGKQIFWYLSAGLNLSYWNQTYVLKKNNQFDADISFYLDPTLHKKREIQEMIKRTKAFVEKNSLASLEMGIRAFENERYLEAIKLFQESLKYDPNNKKTRDYLNKCFIRTGLSLPLPPEVLFESKGSDASFTVEEREILADKFYQEGLDHYYSENYILALQSWQKALDILVVNSTVDRMKLGFSIENIFKHRFYEGSVLKTSLIQFNVALAYYILDEMALIAEVYKEEGNNRKLNLKNGLEINLFDFLTLRGGVLFGQPITFDNRENKFTAGLGFSYDNYSLDYAYEPDNNLYDHSLSFTIRFGISKEEKALSHLNQGIIFAKSGKMEDAEKEWKQALVLDPNQIMARKYLNAEVDVVGSAAKKSQEDKSDELFKKGVSLYKDKDYLNARVHFSEALIINSHHTQARILLEETKEKINNQKADLLIKGQDQLSRKDWENAIGTFELILKYDYASQKAKEGLQKAKENFRENILQHKTRAISFYDNKQYENALNEIDLFLKYESKDQQGREYKFKISHAIEKERTIKNCHKLYENSLAFLNEKDYQRAKEILLQVKNACPDMEGLESRIDFCNAQMEKKAEEKENRARAKDFFQQGLKAFHANDHEQAISLLQKALSLDPELAQADSYIKESQARRLSGIQKKEQAEQAQKLYNESLELVKGEKYFDALDKLNLALSMDRDNKLIQVKINELKDVIKLNIDRPFNEGVTYLNEGRLSKAIEKFQDVLDIQEDHSLARSYLDKALGQKHQSISVHNKLGLKYLDKKDYSKALVEFREVLALEENNQLARDGAEKASGALKNRLNGLFNKGEDLFAKAKYEQAKQQFLKILQIDPGHIPAQEYIQKCDNIMMSKAKEAKLNSFLAKGKEYFKNRFFEEAKKEFLQVLVIEPDNETVKSLLKKCDDQINESDTKNKISTLLNKVAGYYREEDYCQALQLLNDINKIDPDNELVKKYIQITRNKWDNYCDTYYNKAKQMETSGDFATAKKFYLNVQKSNPDYRDIRLILDRFDSSIEDYIKITRKQAQQSYEAKDYERSYALWEKVLLLRPKDREAKKYVAITASRSENIMEGKKSFDKAVSQFEKGRIIESLILFNQALRLNPSLKISFNRTYRETCEKEAKRNMTDLLNSGIQYFEKQDYSKAMDYLNIVYEIGPDNERAKKYFSRTQEMLDTKSKARYEKARDLYKKNQLSEAYSEISQAAEYKPYDENIKSLFKEIESMYNKNRMTAIRAKKGSVDALLFEGIRLYRAGELKKAISKWNQVINIDSNNQKAKSYISRARTKLKALGE
ncbi:MAG: hypothetical protein JW827_11095 [Spirochaetes bacterium]|nr:hypothetical protein [Spirochaetota bacterium]